MIIRRKHTSHFTIVPNSIHDRNELTLEATGLLSYLLSRPKNWEIRHDALRRKFRITRARLSRVLMELIGAGYLQRDGEQPRDEFNRFAAYAYVVRDEPLCASSDASIPLPDHRGRNDGFENKKEDNKNSKNKCPSPTTRNSRVAPSVGCQSRYSEIGLCALSAGMRPVFFGSRPFEAWETFRGKDGMPPIDHAVIDGKSVRLVWMPSVYPPEATR